MKYKRKSIRVINCYLPVACPQNLDKHKEALDKLKTHISNRSPAVIVGDLNGWIKSHNTHKSKWNSAAAKQGVQLKDFAMNIGVLKKRKNPVTEIASQFPTSI